VTDRMMSEHDQRILHSSEDPNWRTPSDCFAALDREFQFNLDLAADRTSTLVGVKMNSQIEESYLGPGSHLAENALTTDWVALGDDPQDVSGFLNPPFSRTLAAAYRTGRIKRDGGWVEHPTDPQLAQVYEIERWVRKCWEESQKGVTVVGLIPFAPQTDWYRHYVYGHIWDGGEPLGFWGWSGHAAREERRLPHRISFLRADGSKANNAGVNTAIIVWKPNPGIIGPWQPHQFYWSYR